MIRPHLAPLSLLAAALLCSCAETTFFDRNSGRPIAKFQNDMIGSEYTDGNTHWKVAVSQHSIPTAAAYAGLESIISQAFAAALAAYLGGGTANASTKVLTAGAPAMTHLAHRGHATPAPFNGANIVAPPFVLGPLPKPNPTKP